METPQDHYIRVGQLNTRYWVAGDQGPTVILLHGVAWSVENWLPTIPILATQHRVYALDVIGHGHTDKPLSWTYSWESLAQFIKDFMAALNVERASLVGLSMGGGIALYFTHMFPTSVEKLVLADSAGLGKEILFDFRLASVPLLGEWLTRPSRQGVARMLKTAVYDPAIVNDELVEQLYQLAILPGAQQAFLKLTRSNLTLFGPYKRYYEPILRALPSITATTLIIWGRQDRWIPVSHAQVAANGLPNARLHILDNCGHLPMYECAADFNNLLVEFLAG